jgi:hypothetical protein
VITITNNEQDPYLDGITLAFGYRNSHAVDYVIALYADADGDGSFAWSDVATITDNTQYEMAHWVGHWRVRKIRLTVTDAGSADKAGILNMATIQATSSLHSNGTGPLLDVGGGTLYGDLDLNGHALDNVGTLTTGATAYIGGHLEVDGPDFKMHAPGRGDGGRALVHDQNDTLTINYGSDFDGGVRINGPVQIVGSCTAATISDEPLTQQTTGSATACTSGSLTTGAVIEGNLQTTPERLANGNSKFAQGDLLCWGDGALELCATARTPLVQAVADASGNPIVLGAEPVRVIGPVVKGQYLVASDVPGYAMAVDDPAFGIVIAQALEEFNGERGLILAMIRKM